MASRSGILGPPIQQIDRTFVRVEGKIFSYFGGCDYFRMSSHPAVVSAVESALARSGLTPAASRVTTGNHEIFERLERALAGFFGAPAALLTSSGYTTNLAVAQALAGSVSRLFIDERAHVSLKDAAVLVGARIVSFRHRSPEDLRRRIGRLRPGTMVALFTDGVFSQDGAIAPLKDYRRILPKNALMVVDDAHGAGVCGHSGQGTHQLENVGRASLIQTMTLSKAFGVFGGAVLASRKWVDRIVLRSGAFAGSTPIPFPLAEAATAAVNVLSADPGFRGRLRANVEAVKAALPEAEHSFIESPAPIFSFIPRNESEASSWARRFRRARIFAPCIRYPGGPPSGHFRIAISSEHSREQLAALAGVVCRLGRGSGGSVTRSGVRKRE